MVKRHLEDAKALPNYDTAEIDNIKILDANADLMYVLAGTIYECGQHEMFEEAYNEVHRSNMTKSFDTRESAETAMLLTVEPSYVHERNGKYTLHRHFDTKVIKPATYSKADLKQFYM